MKKMFLAAAVLVAVVTGCSKKDGGENSPAASPVQGTYRMVLFEQQEDDTSDVNEFGVNRLRIVSYQRTGSNFTGILSVEPTVMNSTRLTMNKKIVFTTTTTTRPSGSTTITTDSAVSLHDAPVNSLYTVEAGKIYIQSPATVMSLSLTDHSADSKFEYSLVNGELELRSNHYRDNTRPGNSQRTRVVTRVVYRKQ